MNYLELVKELAEEIGTVDSDIIESVNDPSIFEPHVRRLIRWIQRAWLEIQMSSSLYRFRRMTDTIQVKEGVDKYHLPFELVHYESLAPYTSPDGHQYLMLDVPNPNTQNWRVYHLPWHQFKGWKQLRETTSRPRTFSVDPEDYLNLHPKPNADYKLICEYVRTPQLLEDDCDIPIMPEQFHQLIVYFAIKEYGMSDEAKEQAPRGKYQYRRLQVAMHRDQLDPLVVVGTR